MNFNENDLPPEFSQLFGNIKKPAKPLTPEQEAGLKMMQLAKKYPRNQSNHE